jgi:hypothetical protein
MKNNSVLRPHSHCQPNRTEPIRLGKQTYVMKWKHSHCTLNRAEPNRTERVAWLMFVFTCQPASQPASRRPILLRSKFNFMGLKCVCTQKRHFLVNKRLLHQILSINENTCTWYDILAVQKCQLRCFQFGSARLAMAVVT